MVEPIRRDRMIVQFSGAEAGTAPLTWGQKSILRDMRDNDDQFTMFGTIRLPEGSTAEDAAAWLSALMHRHAALRMRLGGGPGDRPHQQVAGSGQIGLEVVAIPGNAGRVDRARYLEHLLVTWPRAPFDFHRDWPLRMAVVTQRDAALHLVWVLSHLAADGTANMLLLRELAQEAAEPASTDPQHPDILDVARSEQEPQLRQLSRRTMRYWESQLAGLPALTFGEPARLRGHAGQRYWLVRFRSPAAHLATLAVAGRTGTDLSAVTLAVIATAVGRATGVRPLTVNIMVSNRFRPGLAGVFAPIAENSVLTIDAGDTSIDAVVAQARNAVTAAGVRAYYDPDDLQEVIARLDAGRGYQSRVSFRFNDQRSMVRRTPGDGPERDVTPDQIRHRLPQTSLTWLRPLNNLHDQISIIVQNRIDTLSLHLKCDLWSLTREQVEALLRGIEEVAVEAAAGPAAQASGPSRHGDRTAAPAGS